MKESITTTQTTTATLIRANRIAVQVTPTGFKADFYRTHKKLATLLSEESGWEADASLNKSALRESFRQFAISHSADIGILWNPADLRSEENKRIPKYENDDMLKADAVALLEQDVYQLVAKCPHGVSHLTTEAETIVAVTHSGKGTDLTKLGVIGGKYERSGNWAWADVEMLVTLTKGGEFIYYTTMVQLVSGQLKKPHITQTSFNEAIKTSLQEAGIWEDPKPKTKAEAKVEAEIEAKAQEILAEAQAEAEAEVASMTPEEIHEEAEAIKAEAKKTRKSTRKSTTKKTTKKEAKAE